MPMRTIAIGHWASSQCRDWERCVTLECYVLPLTSSSGPTALPPSALRTTGHPGLSHPKELRVRIGLADRDAHALVLEGAHGQACRVARCGE